MSKFSIFLFAMLGLQLGSFLNVVIYRLPKQLHRAWRTDCADYLGVSIDQEEAQPLMSLQTRSQCPHCGTTLRARDLVPVFSFLVLRGRCAHCEQPVSWRYLCVELAVMATWGLCAMLCSDGVSAALWASFVTTLIALAVIDADTQLLPDELTQPLLWVGLMAASLGLTGVPFLHAFWGAILGYMSLWLLAQGFQKIRGHAGMGAGDFKLFAALGAWLGAWALPWIVLGASVCVMGVALLGRFLDSRSLNQQIPFGPYLVAAALLTVGLKACGLELAHGGLL